MTSEDVEKAFAVNQVVSGRNHRPLRTWGQRPVPAGRWLRAGFGGAWSGAPRRDEGSRDATGTEPASPGVAVRLGRATACGDPILCSQTADWLVKNIPFEEPPEGGGKGCTKPPPPGFLAISYFVIAGGSFLRNEAA